ncbi:MAG: hypothetical protein NTX03_12920 [Bacteroidetes bacterium]|nr:hypothetical protein [Bacteroidota bacterium]
MSAQNPANPTKKKNEKYIALFVLLFFIALIVLAGVSIIKKRIKNKPKEEVKKESLIRPADTFSKGEGKNRNG